MADVVIRVDADGAKAMWTDVIDLRCLGRLRVERASVVVFNDIDQVWEARRLSDGHIIARDPSRKAVLELEAAYFAERL